MYCFFKYIISLLKVLLFTIWGFIHHLLSYCCSHKLPDFSADVCLVTGAGQGLGRLLALKIAETGATLVLWDINEEKVQAVADEIRELGNEVFAYVCDCSKREEVYRTAHQVREEVGDVAVLVNNAGIVSGKKLLDSEDGETEKVFAVNTLAHFWVVKAFLPWMIKNDYGYIISLASIMAFAGTPGLTDYAASKSAAYIFADALRSELRAANKMGITVTCVCPFHIKTGMFKGVVFPTVCRSLEPEEVVERTVRAMAEKQFLVILPRTFYFALFLKSFLPQRAYDELLTLLGADTAMDTFVGHQKKD